MKSNYKDSYIAAKKELVSLSVYNVGFQKCNSHHQWGPGIRDHYLIHYVISGKGSYNVGGKTYQINSGDCFLIYPNTEITYTADDYNPWEYAWVGFTGSDASLILQATDFTKEHPFIRNINFGDDVLEQLKYIYENRGNEFRHIVEMTGGLYKLLSAFMHSSTKDKIETSANTYVQKGIEYISANYFLPITIEDISNYVGISRSHLFRSFESILNTSPKEYLTEFRIKQACYLLSHSNLSITVIANSVGFDNNLYFSKAFSKNKGVSPRDYRKQTTNE